MKKLALVLLFTVAAQAQKLADVRVEQIQDRRTSSGTFSSLTLSLEMPSVMSSTVAASRVLVSAATDDGGNSLMPDAEREVQFSENMRAEMLPKGSKDGPVSVSLELKTPPRASTMIRDARGEIELFMPSKDPNSVAELPKFLPASGKAVSHKALKANGVEITFLTPAQIDAENQKREEWARIQPQEGEIVVRIKDPNKRVHDWRYVNSSGELKRVSVNESEGVAVISSWSDKLQPDGKLRVTMKSPKNTVKYAFALKDVPLP